MKQNAEFKWTGECQEALDTLKKKLVEEPVLVYTVNTVMHISMDMTSKLSLTILQ